MTAITPTFYEAQSEVTVYSFDIVGDWLTNLPSDARCYMSSNNDDPYTFYRDRPDSFERVNVIDKHRATTAGRHLFSKPVYLGLICSDDRKTIYWVNDTRPLP